MDISSSFGHWHLIFVEEPSTLNWSIARAVVIATTEAAANSIYEKVIARFEYSPKY
jgi:hypothetical protein